jgi:hypothetical protein
MLSFLQYFKNNVESVFESVNARPHGKSGNLATQLAGASKRDGDFHEKYITMLATTALKKLAFITNKKSTKGARAARDLEQCKTQEVVLSTYKQEHCEA